MSHGGLIVVIIVKIMIKLKSNKFNSAEYEYLITYDAMTLFLGALTDMVCHYFLIFSLIHTIGP